MEYFRMVTNANGKDWRYSPWFLPAFLLAFAAIPATLTIIADGSRRQSTRVIALIALFAVLICLGGVLLRLTRRRGQRSRQ